MPPIFVGDARTDRALLSLAHLMAEIAANISPPGIAVSDSDSTESPERRNTHASEAVAMPPRRRPGAGMRPIATCQPATDEARMDVRREEAEA